MVVADSTSRGTRTAQLDESSKASNPRQSGHCLENAASHRWNNRALAAVAAPDRLE